MNVKYDRQKMAQYGLNVSDINDLIKTAFAGKASRKDLVNLRVVKRLPFLTGQKFSQGIGPSTGTIGFLSAGHEAGTHGASTGSQLPAIARTIALFYCAHHAAGFRKVHDDA